MTVPLMRMGFAGFSDEQQLLHVLKSRSQTLRWEKAPLTEADALWFNGASAHQKRSGLVRIVSGGHEDGDTIVDLAEIQRPFAFVLPMRDPRIVSTLTMDLRAADSIATVFSHFESSLWSLAAELAIARELHERSAWLDAPVYHLTLRGALVAVVKPGGELAIAPGATAHALAECKWDPRPSRAADFPASFLRRSVAQVMWRYAMRCQEDLMPGRLRSRRWHALALPPPRQFDLTSTQLVLYSAISRIPQTMAELKVYTGIPEPDVSRSMTALWYAGAISTETVQSAWNGFATSAPWQDSRVRDTLPMRGHDHRGAMRRVR